MKVVLRPEAEQDVKAAFEWYATEDPHLAQDFLVAVAHAVSRIRERPNQFPEISKNVRRALSHRFPYAIYFVTRVSFSAVIAVLHNKRRPALWKARARHEKAG
jgi:plasmid stabilization system protein ParE